MIKRIDFSNIKNAPIGYLEGIDFFNKNKSVTFKSGINVIVGLNGCGKTTLSNLIRRYTLCLTNITSTCSSNNLEFINLLFSNENKLKCVPFIIKNDDITPCGYANGYVAVPITHPLYEREYFHDVEDLIPIHGGLTLSTYFSKFPKDKIIQLSIDTIPEDSWVFGFDTKHCYDNKDTWDRISCINETFILLNKLEQYKEKLI